MNTQEELKSLMERICGRAKVVKYQNKNKDGNITALVYCDLNPTPPVHVTKYDELCSHFIDSFSKETNSKWLAAQRYPSETNCFLFRKTFLCQGPGNLKCWAKISIAWKKINNHTRQHDRYLIYGMSCVIELSLKHSHIEYVEDSQLNCFEETKTRLSSSFEAGMDSIAAKNLHELCLIGSSEYDESLVTSLSNDMFNPSLTKVTLLYNNFFLSNPKDDNFQPLALLPGKMESFKNQGHYFDCSVNWQTLLGPYNLVLVTPIKKRAYSECFKLTNTVYTVASIFAWKSKRTAASQIQPFTRVTFFFTPSKVGALPIGCVMNSETTFAAAYSLLKQSLKLIHGEEFNPSILTMENEPHNKVYLNALESQFKEAKKLYNWSRVSQSLWCRLWMKENNISKEERVVLMKLAQQIFESVSAEAAEENCKTFERISLDRCPKIWSFFELLWRKREQWCHYSTAKLLPEHHNHSVESTMSFKDMFLRRCKTLSPSGMIDAVCISLENYYRLRLLALASPTAVSVPFHFWRFSGLLGLNPMPEVVMTGVDEYTVGCSDGSFTVYTALWICDCLPGRSNVYCDHILLVRSLNNTAATSNACLSLADRDVLKRIALGKPHEENDVKIKVEPEEVKIKVEPEEVQDISTDTSPSQEISVKNEVEIKVEPEEVRTQEAQKRFYKDENEESASSSSAMRSWESPPKKRFFWEDSYD